MKCKKCGKDFIQSKGLINYCSLACRNSREITEEHKAKTSASLIGRRAKPRSLELIKKHAEKVKATWERKLLSADFDSLSFERLRNRVKIEQGQKCGKCGISEWMGSPITLELDHKDGNHHNNKRENLEALCPNCHSQTDTWRGRNKKDNKKKVSDEELSGAIFDNDFNFRQALLSVGLAAKGGNYGRCHKLAKIMTSKL